MENKSLSGSLLRRSAFIFIFMIYSLLVFSQTESDAIMMNKNQFCNGFVYSSSSWSSYWEGERKRVNENLGTVSTSSLAYMANYGIKNNFNLMVGIPFVKTNASAGTLKGVSGIQDLSMFLKWKAVDKKIGKKKFSVFGITGFSLPIQDYVIDYLPLSIGLGSKSVIGKLMLDYQWKRWTITASSAYHNRSNVRLDRDSYYTTQLHLTNEVAMPDALQSQFRFGYRGKFLIAEGLLTNWTTLGGFDITRNNMPFPSNRMNGTTTGLYIKYTVKKYTNLSILANAHLTLDGRNMGQSTMYTGGIFYAFYVDKKDKEDKKSNKKTIN